MAGSTISNTSGSAKSEKPRSDKSRSTGTTEKSNQDKFHLDGTLRNIQAANKGKAPAVQTPSSAGGRSSASGRSSPPKPLPEVGAHLNLLPLISDDRKKWPATAEPALLGTLTVLQDKTTKEYLYIVKPKASKGRTKSLLAAAKQQIQKFTKK